MAKLLKLFAASVLFIVVVSVGRIVYVHYSYVRSVAQKADSVNGDYYQFYCNHMSDPAKVINSLSTEHLMYPRNLLMTIDIYDCTVTDIMNVKSIVETCGLLEIKSGEIVDSATVEHIFEVFPHLTFLRADEIYFDADMKKLLMSKKGKVILFALRKSGDYDQNAVYPDVLVSD